MNHFKTLTLGAAIGLLFANMAMGQTRRYARGGDAAASVARSVNFGPSAAGASGMMEAQGTSSSTTVVPRLMKFSGTLRDAAGKPLTGAVDVTFSLYSTEAGGDALWFETQSIQADELGRYTALLGAMHADGLPTELFTSGEVRWLGIQVGHEPEQQPRVLLVSVPYALKAGDAETLGGKPASAYMLSDSQKSSTSTTSVVVAPTGTTPSSATGTSQKVQASGTSAPLTACASVTSDGTAVVNYIPLFTTACNVQNSILYQVNGRIGMGTTTPQAVFHMYGPASHDADAQYTMISTDTTSAAQGTGGGIAFAGFYNGTINKAGFANIRGVKENGIQGDYASTLIFDTRVNGGNQTERMRITSAGNVGIGTSTPAAKLEVNGTAQFDGAVTFASGQNVTGNFNVIAPASGATGISVQTTDASAGNTAISGMADGIDGSGVVGEAENGAAATGVWGISSSGLAGLFSGDINVTGAITAGTKDFKIDDPIDPANKFLYHASVESSQMKTIYDGATTLDSRGEAEVQLPAWFDALNGEFRYQLTCVGGYAPVYIAQKIQGNSFKIAGGKPGIEVDWQVTGVRHDAYAQAHPLTVEVEKAAHERGFYLHPQLFGAPKEKAMEWADHPEQMARRKQKIR